MGFFNDYQKFANRWGNCKSKAIKRTICIRPAQDATRKDLIIDHDKRSAIEKEMSQMRLKKQLEKAVYLSRQYGESFVVFLDNPKDGDNITANGQINQYSRTIAVRRSLNKDGDNFLISVEGQELKIDPSRVFKIEGDYDENLKPISAYHYVDNEIDALWEVIKNTMQILKKSSIHTMKIEGLDEMLGDALNLKETQEIKDSLDEIAKKLNNDNAIFLDTKNSLDSVSLSLNGISETCNELKGIIAGNTLPELILFDRAPQGMSSSRREQLEHYHSMVDTIRESLTHIYDAIFDKVITDYGDIAYDFAPLDTLSSKEKAEIRQLNLASADSIISTLNLNAVDALKVYQSLDIVDDLKVSLVDDNIFDNPYENKDDEENDKN